MTLRVLAVTASYPSPRDPQRAVFLENLHRALVTRFRSELELTVVAPRVHREDPAHEVRHGLPVRRFAYPSGGKRLKEFDDVPWFRLALYLISAWWRVIWEARRGDYDVVVCHWILPAGLVGRAACLVLGKPLVLWAHGTDVRRFVGRSRPATWIARWVARGADMVFAVNEDLASRIRDQLRVEPNRLRVLPMGVADAFRPGDAGEARRRVGLDDALHLLYVGDLSEAKGIRDLLEAFRQVSRNGTRVELHVAGRGPLRDEVDAEPGTYAMGSVEQADLADWYRAVDLFVFASHSEGAPVVVMEALSSGLPVVATRVGGVPELVDDGVTGILVEPARPDELADALSSLICDADRRMGMRRRILDRSGEFSAEARASELVSALRELVEDPSG